MLNSKLIIVEGVMGSGKSTTAEFISLRLRQNNIKTRYFWEGNRSHPLIARREYPTPGSPWRDFTPEGFSGDFIPKMYNKWKAFVSAASQSDEVTVSDGQFFHGDMTLLLMMDTDQKKIIEHFDRIVELTRPINPLLIYLYQSDTEQSLHEVFNLRGRKWRQFQVGWKTECPFCKRRDLKGYNGLIELYKEYRRLTDKIFNRVPIRKLAIENSQRHWPNHYEQVFNFLSNDSERSLYNKKDHFVEVNRRTTPKGEEYDIDIFGNATLNALESLLEFRKLRSLRIQHNAALTNLDSLNHLCEIRNLRVAGNGLLSSIKGLSNVRNINGRLEIYENPSLESLKGLENITAVEVSLQILRNENLKDVSAFGRLSRVDGSFLIKVNSKLSTLEGLNSLIHVGKNLEISDNPALNDLSGLESLTHVGEDLEVSHNKNLVNLNGLEGLTVIGGCLKIINNDVLRNLDGLRHLTGVTSLQICNNPLLPSQEIRKFIDRLASHGFEGEMQIEANQE